MDPNHNLPAPLLSSYIAKRILNLRGQAVLLDVDLADLYEVPTGELNRAVKRNASRFPSDFMFQLSREEVTNLRFQFGISSSEHGGRRFRPYAFTEQGVAMLSGVLRSERAVKANVAIMRAFVRMRGMLSANSALARRLDELEAKYDGRFRKVFDAIRALMSTELVRDERLRSGFRTPGESSSADSWAPEKSGRSAKARRKRRRLSTLAQR
jgi:hypothetical protein